MRGGKGSLSVASSCIYCKKAEAARVEIEWSLGRQLVPRFLQHKRSRSSRIDGAIKLSRKLLHLSPAAGSKEIERIAPLVDEAFYWSSYPDA